MTSIHYWATCRDCTFVVTSDYASLVTGNAEAHKDITMSEGKAHRVIVGHEI